MAVDTLAPNRQQLPDLFGLLADCTSILGRTLVGYMLDKSESLHTILRLSRKPGIIVQRV